MADYPAFRFDWQRKVRTGIPETVMCEGKTDDQIVEIIEHAQERGARLFLSRLDSARAEKVEIKGLDYCPLSRTAIMGGIADLRPDDASVALVCAGTSDLPVVEEARRTFQFHGCEVPVFADVGVAGLWRVMSVAEELSRYRVLIAVAGMEGALFSVLAGLVPGVVIAVPSPVGYGVSKDGAAALSAALSCCAPGVVTVNIGNGYGAAVAAMKMLNSASAGQGD
ncbi:nickel pincer cofactor biosynthesis protein LarB [Paracoccus albus]|uniref:nickel pincer cofactor biosynthesis protein LarB n=1 Tax=Paracoccus albus TaxID=3017784 RepID=UPI0022F07247|nr:nickel pincer cofactor biosynthesis protein LarB [Paracoccus albus]WBU61512.1 nickel pincer cofactor biosynthesis protein LarB [Paracoccus albus]